MPGLALRLLRLCRLHERTVQRRRSSDGRQAFIVPLQLLRYARLNEIPAEDTTREQAADLAALQRLLELDGFRCTAEAGSIPVLVEKGGKRLAVGIKSGLLDESWQGHSLQRTGIVPIQILNDFILRRNLPDEHQLIRKRFGD